MEKILLNIASASAFIVILLLLGALVYWVATFALRDKSKNNFN